MGNKYQVEIDAKLNKDSVTADLNKLLSEIKKNAKIEIDISGSSKKLNELKTSLKSLSKIDSSSLKNVNSEIKKLSEGLASLGNINSKGLGTISKSIGTLSTQLQALNKLEFGNLSKLSSGIEKLAKSFNSIESVDIKGVTQLKEALQEVKTGLNGLTETKITSFTGLNTAVSGAIKQINKMKDITVEDVEKMEITLMSMGTAMTKAFSNTTNISQYAKSMENVAKVMQEINKMDAGKVAKIISSEDVAQSKQQKQLLSEIISLKKQMATTINDQSFNDLATKLNKAETELKQLGTTFTSSQSHVNAWEKYVDKAFDNITKNADKLESQMSKAFEMKNISSSGLQTLEQLKGKLQELQSIQLKGANGGFLNESELRQANVLINQISSGMKSLKVDSQSIKMFQGFQSEANDVTNKLNNIKSNINSLKTTDVKIDIDIKDEEIKECETLLNKIKNTPIDADTSQLESDLNRVKTLVGQLEGKLDSGLKQKKFDIKVDGVISSLEKIQNEAGQSSGKVQELITKLQALKGSAGNKVDVAIFDELQKEAKETIDTVTKANNQMSSNTSGFWNTLNNTMSTYTPVYMMSRALTTAFQGTWQSIVDMDSAFRDLAKVAPNSFTGTAEELDGIRKKASEVANEVASTSTKVIDATAKALQMGIKNIDSAMQYAKNANIYANVTDLDQDTADTQLASILSAYGGVENALKPMRQQIQGATKDYNLMTQYMDLANHAGNNFSITSGDVGKALEKAGSVLKTTGVDLGEAISLIVGANESIQDADKVGTSLKAIATNLVGLKTSAKDGSISANKTAMALDRIGISCQNTDGSVKSTTDILRELGAVWDELSNADQMAIAEALGGKNHINTVTALMNNWQRVLEYQQAYNNGDYVGSAAEENARYIDSIEGKITQLKENITQLVTTIFKTDAMKGFLDVINKGLVGLNGFVQKLDAMGVLTPTILGLGVAFKSLVSGMSEGGKLLNLASIFTKLTSGGKSLTSALTSSATASATAGAGLASMGASAGLAMLKTVALNGAIVAGVALLGYGAYKIYDSIANKYKHMAEEAQQSSAKIKDNISTLNSQKSTLKNLGTEYETLSKKAQLSADEEQRMVEIRNQIAELAPQLVTGYDKDGNAIINLNQNLDRALEKYDQLIERQQRLLQMSNEKEAIANTEMLKGTVDDLVKSRDNMIKQAKELRDIDSTQSKLNNNTSVADATGDIDKGSLSRFKSYLDKKTKLYDDYYKNNIDAYTDYSQKSAQIQEAMLGKLDYNNQFKKLTTSQQALSKQLGSMLDWGALDSTEQGKVTNALARMGGELEKSGINLGAFQSKLERLNYEYANGSMSSGVYQEKIRGMAQELANLSGLDVDTWMKALQGVPELFDSMTMAEGEFFRNFNANLSDIGSKDLATMLDVQFNDLNNVMNDALADIEFNGETTGEYKMSVDMMTEIRNLDSLPMQLQGAIDGILQDGEITEQETTIFIDMLTEYQQTGEISNETLDRYMDIIGEGNLTADMKFRLSASVDDNLKQYLFNKDLDAMSEQDREIVTKFTTVAEGTEKYDEIEQALDELGLKGKAREEKRMEMIASAQFENEQIAANISSTLHSMGFDDSKSAQYLASIIANVGGDDLGKFSTVRGMFDYFVAHPDVASKVGLSVDGIEKVEEAKQKLEELNAKGKDADIIKKIIAELEQGNYSAVLNQLESLGNDDIKVQVATILEENAAEDTLLQMTAKEYIANVKVNSQGAEETKAQIDSIVNTPLGEKIVKISDGGSGASTKKSAEEVSRAVNNIPNKQYKISDGGTGRSTKKSADQVASAVNGIPSSKSVSITANASSFWSVYNSLPTSKGVQTGGKGDLPTKIIPIELNTNPVAQSYALNTLGLDSATARATENLTTAGNAINSAQSNYASGLARGWQEISQTTWYSKAYVGQFADYLDKNVEMFKNLEMAMKDVSNMIKLCDAQLDNAFGTQRIEILQRQVDLYNRQRKLIKEQYNDMSRTADLLQSSLVREGFAFSDDGNISNYSEQLRALEDNLKSYEDTYNDLQERSSKDSENKTLKNQAEQAKKNYDDYKKYVDSTKSKLNEYYDLQYNEIPKLEQEYEELEAQMRKAQDKIEQLRFDDALYRDKNAVEQLNQSMKVLNSYLEKYKDATDNSIGQEQVENLKKQQSILQSMMHTQQSLNAYTKSEMQTYREKLSQYGAIFDEQGNLANQAELLNRYQNSAELDKVSDWVDEYNDLAEEMMDTDNEVQNLTYDYNKLTYAIKRVELDEKIKRFRYEVESSASYIEKLNNELDLLNSKMDYAFGSDKIKLMNQQMALLNSSISMTTNKLNDLRNEESILQNELANNGFAFDSNGNITNYADAMSRITDSNAKEYIEDVYDQWSQIHESEIPNAIQAIEDYQDKVESLNMDKLKTTQEIEKKITEIYKDQIEKRKQAIQDETDKVKSELEKQKQAYKDMRSDAKYEDEYDEQLKKIKELEDRIASLRMSDSLEDKASLTKLLEELDTEQKALKDLVTDKIDSDIEKDYDKQISDIEEYGQKAIDALEKEWTDEKIAQIVQQALSTSTFTDLEGNVTSLEQALLSFSETSGEAFGVMGEYIQSELITNMQIAIDTVKELDSIMNSLGVNSNADVQQALANYKEQKTVNVGDVYVTISEGVNPQVAEDTGKAVVDAFDDIVNRM